MPDDLDDVPPPTDADLFGATPLDDDPNDALMTTTATAAKAAAAAEKSNAIAVNAAMREAARSELADQIVRHDRGWFDEPPPPLRFLFRLTPASDGSANLGDEIAWMPRGMVCLLTAPGGTGKSTLLAALALSVAVGRDLIRGLRPEGLERGQRVLFVLGEESRPKVRRMFYSASRVLGLTPAEKDRAARHLYTFAGAGQIVRLYDEIELREQSSGGSINRITTDPTDFAEVLKATLDEPADDGEPPWALVVLDPASRFSGAQNENDNAAATRFVQALEVLRGTRDEPTVLVAHHTGKGQVGNNASSARGASALVDGARWLCTLERHAIDNADAAAPNVVKALVVKSNDTPIWPTLPMLWLRVKPGPEGYGVTLTRETAGEATAREEYEAQRKASAQSAAAEAKAEAKVAAAKAEKRAEATRGATPNIEPGDR